MVSLYVAAFKIFTLALAIAVTRYAQTQSKKKSPQKGAEGAKENQNLLRFLCLFAAIVFGYTLAKTRASSAP